MFLFWSGTDLNDVEPLRTTDYNPAGRTAFFDAVQQGIELADKLKQKDERVVCILITDGEDTASKQNVSCKAIKKLVKKYDQKADWSFTYIGKPPEYWSRKKPVSKISFECHVQKQVNQRHKSVTTATRKLREFAIKRQLIAQWLVLDSLLPLSRRDRRQYLYCNFPLFYKIQLLTSCIEQHRIVHLFSQIGIVRILFAKHILYDIVNIKNNKLTYFFTTSFVM